MISLSLEEYKSLIQKINKEKKKGYQSEMAYWMKRWDEVRTDLNPNAKWYDDKEVNHENNH